MTIILTLNNVHLFFYPLLFFIYSDKTAKQQTAQPEGLKIVPLGYENHIITYSQWMDYI